MYNIEVNIPNIETWEHSGDCNVGIVALRTAKEKGSLMHPPPPRKATPLLPDKDRSAHVMSTLSKYLFKIYCYSNFR
jgi:hypothetical protein